MLEILIIIFFIFFLQLYEQGESRGTITELMMEQVEFSNVVLLNKQDLVDQVRTFALSMRWVGVPPANPYIYCK